MTEAPPQSQGSGESEDPSMEEILASIRRILNEDEQVAPADKPEAAPGADDDVLVLDESMMVAAAAPLIPELPAAPVEGPAAPLQPEAEPDPTRVDPHLEAVMDTPTVAAGSPTDDLVAPEAAAAAASSVGSLMRTLAAGRGTQVYSGGPTLEDMVRAELRPMLKEWLDANLPPVVERLVRAEIERVVGRAVP